jgi:hypothetical protein
MNVGGREIIADVVDASSSSSCYIRKDQLIRSSRCVRLCATYGLARRVYLYEWDLEWAETEKMGWCPMRCGRGGRRRQQKIIVEGRKKTVHPVGDARS